MRFLYILISCVFLAAPPKKRKRTDTSVAYKEEIVIGSSESDVSIIDTSIEELLQIKEVILSLPGKRLIHYL